MARAYSLDLRKRVVAAVDGGQSRRSAAKTFSLSISVVKWSQRFRSKGSAAPGQVGGQSSPAAGRATRLHPRASRGRAPLDAARSARRVRRTRRRGELRRALERRSPRRRTFKKSVLPAEQDRPDVARRRARWKKYQARIDPRRHVFIDETWAKTNMAPLRGWCARGKRLAAKVPHGHWRTMTFLAALRHDRIDAPWVLEEPIDGESFRIYVEQVLLPTLRSGDVVVIDNLGSHKGKAVRTAIRSVGAKLLFLPPYSPANYLINAGYASI